MPVSHTSTDTPAGPALRVLQITDTHLYGDPEGRLLGLRTQTSFDWILRHVQTNHWPADLILATGDLVHDGSLEGYRRLHDAFAALDVPVYCLAGNHDRPANLAASMNGDKVRTVPCAAHGGWAFVFLDSTREGSEGGHLNTAELERLESCLLHHDGRHVLVCLHHQPLPVGSAWMDTMAVDNGEELLAVLDRHPHVRGLVWGHVHQVFEGERNGVRLLASPSTCVQFLPRSREFGLDRALPGYRWLELKADGAIATGVERLERCPEGLNLKSGGY